jgi:SAM-dependent methyltransferase
MDEGHAGARVEHRVEVAGEQPDYSGREFSQEEIEAGAHRQFIGGVWDTHGGRQVEYMQGQGLQPHHRLVDIGCGPFRAGRHFIDFLEPGNYYGVEANHSLIQAGYDVELSEEQRARLPITNLRANDRFDVDFGVRFDYAVAQSVFTHVSLNHIRLCLYRLAPRMQVGGSFYATFFRRPASTPVDTVIPSKRGKPFFNEKNVFWHYSEDLAWAAQVGPWRYDYIGDWGHPANQKMARFVRVAEPAPQRQEEPPRVSTLHRGRRWLARHLDPAGGR